MSKRCLVLSFPAGGMPLLPPVAPLAVTHQPVDRLPPHGLLPLVALVAAIAAQGAYYGGGRLLVAGVLVLALVAALRASPWSGGDSALGPGRAAAALAGWAAVSAAQAGEVFASLPGIALLASVAVVLLAVRRLTRDQRDTLAEAVLVVGVLAAVTGWAGVAWRIPPWALADQGLWRAATTLTYANGAAGLLVPLALLALARLATRPRVPAVVCACLLLTGAGATLSRGGVFALAVGLAVLGGLLGPARTLRAAGPPSLGAILALAGLAPSMPGGAPPRPLLAAAALLAGLALAVGAARLRGRQQALVLAAAAVAVAAVAVGGTTGSVADDLAGTRLTVASPDRVAAARAALRVAADRPLTGAGPNRAVLTWVEDGRRVTSRYAHNEYLQALAELGLVGLALLSALLVSAGWTVWRGRLHAPSLTVWAGAVAGLAALAVHSAFDFLWHLPAIPLTGAVLAGLVLPPAIDQEGGARPPSSPTEEE
jgi:O-Antigen ligase